MLTKLSINPKLIISQCFDSLFREIDIYIEQQLAKYTDDQLIDLPTNEEIYQKENKQFENSDFDSNTKIKAPNKATRVVAHDYFNQRRQEMFAELTTIQLDAFKRYQLIKNELEIDEWLSDEDQIEQFEAQLYAEKFAFIMEKKSWNPGSSEEDIYDIRLVVLDFYLKRSERSFLM